MNVETAQMVCSMKPAPLAWSNEEARLREIVWQCAEQLERIVARRCGAGVDASDVLKIADLMRDLAPRPS